MRDAGKVVTACGPVEPGRLGAVLMHEHLHADTYDWERGRIPEEAPMSAERRELLLGEIVPSLGACAEHGCGCLVDATFAPSRAWPTFYVEVSELTGVHIVVSTGYYREVEVGSYWVQKPEDSIWAFVRQAPVDELAEFCIREILEGIHGTEVRAGTIKLGTSAPEMTEAEIKAFRAGARAQHATGVHITTHCTRIGAESTQLRLLEAEGVNLERVVVGHTARHLMDPDCRKTCIEWMRRGANFLPTNLGIAENDPEGKSWQPLVEAIHEVFELGLGDRLAFGLDASFSASHGPGPLKFRNTPPPPFLHLFTHTLPVFRELGLTEEQERTIMQVNPQRILPAKN